MITTGLVLGLTGFHVGAGELITGDLSTLAPLVLLTLWGVLTLPTLLEVVLRTSILIGLAASWVLTSKVGIGRLVLLLAWIVHSVAQAWVLGIDVI